MHTVTIDNPSAFATGARRSSQMRLHSLRRLVIIRAAALRALFEVAVIVILVLIPWNAAKLTGLRSVFIGSTGACSDAQPYGARDDDHC
jgi:hypothetical protein